MVLYVWVSTNGTVVLGTVCDWLWCTLCVLIGPNGTRSTYFTSANNHESSDVRHTVQFLLLAWDQLFISASRSNCSSCPSSSNKLESGICSLFFLASLLFFLSWFFQTTGNRTAPPKSTKQGWLSFCSFCKMSEMKTPSRLCPMSTIFNVLVIIRVFCAAFSVINLTKRKKGFEAPHPPVSTFGDRSSTLSSLENGEKECKKDAGQWRWSIQDMHTQQLAVVLQVLTPILPHTETLARSKESHAFDCDCLLRMTFIQKSAKAMSRQHGKLRIQWVDGNFKKHCKHWHDKHSITHQRKTCAQEMKNFGQTQWFCWESTEQDQRWRQCCANTTPGANAVGAESGLWWSQWIVQPCGFLHWGSKGACLFLVRQNGLSSLQIVPRSRWEVSGSACPEESFNGHSSANVFLESPQQHLHRFGQGWQLRRVCPSQQKSPWAQGHAHQLNDLWCGIEKHNDETMTG